ncbi:thiamine diphosphokinase [Pseudobacteroides cellulosolvens]|uniref:Thiamine diphosphokinase n=1 Tax=Pseudobacteroides cellulosolvens ATCC 35603 = DSM 2933 TaxID=398512 RepID=A0A0L6JQR0_9FIRM|nr:thiamine diphosphokinase [Pseudobacteroides cellulosolvens]KNY28129.1 thiamine pyrophosphokinase [Pseudobacteroides cellulosolvens ATCC 35603 = DSM 2933]
MKAVIVCSGSVEDYDYHKKFFAGCSMVVSVDGGARHLRKLGIFPDIMIGDFDSVSKEDYQYFKDAGVIDIRYPSQKDMTDTELALEYVVDKGVDSIVLLGCLGTRFDHSLSNIFLLKKMSDKNINCIIANERNEIQLIKDHIILKNENNMKLTILSLTDSVEGVTSKGLLYPLDNDHIKLGSSRGVSNEFTGEIAEISVNKGLLLVIKSID